MSLRSPCPIAATLDLVGDKWTLLVVRDMLVFDRHRFGEFVAADEGITTSILADRLKRLEEAGLVRREPYQQHPVRYEYHLTERGRELAPVLQEMARWGLKHVSGACMPPEAKVGPTA